MALHKGRRVTTTQKGLGWQHQRRREYLLMKHKDGSACWWCGKPMWKDKTRNHDGLALAADHEEARVNGGTRANRLLHSSCNSSRKAGDRDHLRPALQAQDAVAPQSESVKPPRKPAFKW